ncbi:MAG: hypothetical protein AAF637_17390 [Pseudomonadota bacterium]
MVDMRWIWNAMAWIGIVVVSLLVLRFIQFPFIWIFLLLATAFGAHAALGRARRALWLNVAAVFVALGAAEYYLSLSDVFADRVDEGSVDQVFSPHEELGWAPPPGQVVQHKRSFEGDVIYDVDYTIAPNGLRISSPPNVADHPGQDCILMFGGSFMFGQGLEDDEALPFQLNVLSDNHYRPYNFAVMGYGAHQMLAALERGLVEEVVDCKADRVSHAIYNAIPDHIRRSAGRVWWNTRGPIYRLNADGGAEFAGYLEDTKEDAIDKSWTQLIENQFSKSRIYLALYEGTYARKYDRETIDLYLSIVARAESLIRAEYPRAQLHVLWWDEDDLDNQAVIDGLRERAIALHLMSDILPNYESDAVNMEYRFDWRDTHPNALANDLIARYALRNILSDPRRGAHPPADSASNS